MQLPRDASHASSALSSMSSFPPDRIPPLYNALTVEVNLAGQG